MVSSAEDSQSAISFLFWMFLAMLSAALIYLFGLDFVNKPKLAQAKVKTEWNEAENGLDAPSRVFPIHTDRKFTISWPRSVNQSVKSRGESKNLIKFNSHARS